MRVTVESTLGDLESDLRKIAAEAPRKFRKVVSDNVRAGNKLAKDIARQTSGTHARLYPGTFTSEMHGSLSSLGGGALYQGEYGPEHRGQGELAGILENGSRNNPGHGNLRKSADLIGPTFADQATEALHSLFWPES